MPTAAAVEGVPVRMAVTSCQLPLALNAARPDSPVLLSQSVSAPSHSSVAPGWMWSSLSSQSVEDAAYPAGASHAMVLPLPVAP